VRSCFLRQILPLFKLLFEALHKALPELPTNILLAHLQFTMGAMSHVMCSSARPLPQIPGFPEPLAEDALTEQLLAFVCAGMETPC